MTQCECIVDGYCPRYKRHMVGRLRQICAGVDISPTHAEAYRKQWEGVSKKLILTCFLSPGDLLAMSAAIFCLHSQYPGEYQTDVRTSCNDIFAHNPHITELGDDATIVEMHYPAIDRSNEHSTQFLTGYTEYLAEQLQRRIPNVTNRPVVYFDEAEKVYTGKPYWLINAGIKSDYTCKQWPIEYYQAVVNSTRHFINWIQIGELHQKHTPLDNVENLIGRTTFRELMVLALHSSGAIGPVTALMHLQAAVEKPYICLNGGRESIPWIQYQAQHTLHTIGLMDCCKTGGCWKSKVLEDCVYPITTMKEPVAKCMQMIKPIEVIAKLCYLQGLS